MAPNVSNEDIPVQQEQNDKITKVSPRRLELVYTHIIAFVYYHLAACYGVYILFKYTMWQTILFGLLVFWLAGLGVIAGAHRLWSHKTYKARRPLQVFLMLCHSIANQLSVIQWARDHRLHHKFSDTDADPHNINRGFFFAHIGWVLVKRHEEVRKRRKLIDNSDLENNPVLAFQYRHQLWFIPLLAFILPTAIPMYFWKETLSTAWHINMLRYIINLNFTFCINSFAHMWGNRPYDNTISPSQNLLLYHITLGEGFHNYHHVFPYDYRSNEFGRVFSSVTCFIDVCAKLGLAYDLKIVSEDMARARMRRTGDGSKPPAFIE